MTQQQLKDYAKLIIVKGVNLQPDQELIISASVTDYAFVEMLVEEAYLAKAKKVSVDWTNQAITKLKFLNEDQKVIEEILPWQKSKLEDRVNKLPATIRIISDDPDGMKGVDPAKLASFRKTYGMFANKYHDKMDNKYQWCIAALPSEAWAMKVFPDAPNAYELLEKAIFSCARATGNALENWDIHDKNLRDKCELLNSLDLKKLHFKNKLGTNLTVELPKECKFSGGGDETLSGIYYQPNIPTEECFTSPAKKKVKGVVYASMPLSIAGVLVSDFGFRFDKGKVVEVLAKDDASKEILEKLIATDEGSSYLGEVALVPANSPIADANILFYNTLFDENASCHLALGNAYVGTIKDYDKMTNKEIKKVGLNKSIIHVDFMFGTPDLKITGFTRDGKKVAIFRHGNWAI